MAKQTPKWLGKIAKEKFKKAEKQLPELDENQREVFNKNTAFQVYEA